MSEINSKAQVAILELTFEHDMKKNLFIPDQNTPHFSMKSLIVTTKRDFSSLKKVLSKEEFHLFHAIHKEANLNPKKALKKAKKLSCSHPHRAEILNLLTYLLLRGRNLRKAHALMIENYTLNPDNLFAKINYADYCLRKRKTEKIPEIFHQHFDLRLLYPDRQVFHLSEFRGFMVLMGFYHLSIEKKEIAESYFYLAYRVDQTHPSVQLLKRKLYSRKDLKVFPRFFKCLKTKILRFKRL